MHLRVFFNFLNISHNLVESVRKFGPPQFRATTQLFGIPLCSDPQDKAFSFSKQDNLIP